MADDEDTEGTEPEETQTGVTSPPAPQPGNDEAQTALIEKLKGENKQHREDKRRMHAENLVLRFKLPQSQTDLLALLDVDKQEAKAQAIAEEMKATLAAAQQQQKPPPTQTGDAPDEPDDEPDAATSKALGQMDGAGGVPPATGDAMEQLRKQIAKAEGEGDIKTSIALKNQLLAEHRARGKV